VAVAAQPVWDDNDEENHRGAVKRADAAWQGRVDAAHERTDEQMALIGEYAATADAMAVLARRREWSPQHIATARRLAGDAMRVVRLLERN